MVYAINSLDSLSRLYTDNLNMTVERLGKLVYILITKRREVLSIDSMPEDHDLDFRKIETVH